MLPPPGFVPTAVSSSSTLTDVVLLSASVSSTPTLLPTSATALSSSLIASATLISASATPSQGSGSSPKDDDGAGECQLLGPFALFIQGALGLLAMLSLVWKRYRERPQRPVKIWAFDVSKQIVGSVLVHVANLLMSMLSAGQFTVKPKASGASGSSDSRPDEQYRPNPCSFYLLNLAIDVSPTQSSLLLPSLPKIKFRPQLASQSSSFFSASSHMAFHSRPLASRLSRSNPASTAIHPRPTGGSSSPSYTFWGFSA